MLRTVSATLMILLMIGAQSCVTDLDFQNPNFTSKLVANCVFNPDESFTVHLTNSRNILDPNDEIGPISDAKVIIHSTKDQIDFELEEFENGIYSLPGLKPVPGYPYTLKVSADGYESVNASSLVPEINSGFTIDTSILDFDGQQIFKIDIQISDSEGMGNFYVWEMELLQGSDRYLSNIKSTDSQTEQIISSDAKQTKIFLNDDQFDGQDYSTSFYSSEAFSNPGTNTTSEVRLFSVSEDLYNYYRTFELYQSLNTNSNTNLSAPLQVHSNINNGLGIFAGFNLSKYQFEIF
jgi:hypothetical protein